MHKNCPLLPYYHCYGKEHCKTALKEPLYFGKPARKLLSGQISQRKKVFYGYEGHKEGDPSRT